MGFSTKPVAASANLLLFLTFALLAHSTSFLGCLRGPAEPGQSDLKVSYRRSSPQVSCCGCPSNPCLKPPSAGMLARSPMMGRFLVHLHHCCHHAQYFSAPLSVSFGCLASSARFLGEWSLLQPWSDQPAQPRCTSPKEASYIQTAYCEGLQDHAITQNMLWASLLWVKTMLRNVLAVKQCRALALVCIDKARLPAQTFHRQFKL